MNTVTQVVQAALIANAALIAVVPALNIMVEGDLQEVQPPYLVHRIVNAEETGETHDRGLDTLKFWRYQVACYATKWSDVDQIAALVRAALGSYRNNGIASHWIGDQAIPYLPDERISQLVCEFKIADMLT